MTKNKNIFSRIFFSNYFFPLIIVLIAILGSSFFKSYTENKSVDNDLESLKREIEDLEKNNNDLGRLIEYFNSSFFVEKEAREKMGLKKEGENVLVVEGGLRFEEDDKVVSVNNKQLADNNSMPKLWWNYFFDKK